MENKMCSRQLKDRTFCVRDNFHDGDCSPDVIKYWKPAKTRRPLVLGILFGVLIGFLLFALIVLFMGRPVHAQEAPRSWVIFNNGGAKVTKIQDGSCSVYVVEDKFARAGYGVATGQGCK